jgi:hypothetical protein
MNGDDITDAQDRCDCTPASSTSRRACNDRTPDCTTERLLRQRSIVDITRALRNTRGRCCYTRRP